MSTSAHETENKMTPCCNQCLRNPGDYDTKISGNKKGQLTEQLPMNDSTSFGWTFISMKNVTVGFSKRKLVQNMHHSGHIWLSPEEVMAKSSTLQKGKLKMICDSSSLLISKDAIQATLGERTKMSLTSEKLSVITNSMKTIAMKKGRKSTTAERSMKNLKGDDNITHCAPTADVGCEQLITVTAQSQSNSGQSGSTLMSASMSMSMLKGTAVPFEEEKTSFCWKCLCHLKLKNGEQLLLLVAWIEKRAMTEFIKYPEVIGFDVTMGTNSEKCPLVR